MHIASEIIPWIVSAVVVLYWAAVIVALILDDRDPTATLAWIIVLVTLPVVGFVFYFFFGRNWQRNFLKNPVNRKAKDKFEELSGLIQQPYLATQSTFGIKRTGTLDWLISSSIAKMNKVGPVPAVTLDVYTSGEKFFNQLKLDLKSAQKFINLQFFIWECDPLTREITDILIERVESGVEVRLTYDWFGSLRYGKKQLRELERAGGIVRADEGNWSKLNYRNHRKSVIIDGLIGYTGGHNVGKEYIDGGKRFAKWRDTTLRVTGPAVGMLQNWFAYHWMTNVDDDAGQFDLKFFPGLQNPVSEENLPLCQVVAQGADDTYQSARRAHMVAISSARRIIRIQSPYFIPSEGMYDAMINAALSGVEVHFMMTGIPDKKLAYWAGQSYWPRLMAAGGHVYIYKTGFLHAKTICVDSEAFAIGTLNMDIRSFNLHRELMFWCFDNKLTRQQERTFDEDLKECKEITLEDIEGMGINIRLRNSVVRLGSSLM